MKRKILMKDSHGFLVVWARGLLLSAVLSTIFAALISVIFANIGFKDTVETYFRDIELSNVDVFLTQCQITFVVVSLVAFLSGNSDDVLWEDTISYNLVNPIFFNIKDVSAYLIGSLVGTLGMLLLNNRLGVLIIFLFSILLLTYLTFKLMGAFFTRDVIKSSLEKQYRKSTKDEKRLLLVQLTEKTLQEIEEIKYSKVRENIDFLLTERGKVPEETEETETCFLTIMRHIMSKDGELFYEICKKHKCFGTKEIHDMGDLLCERMMENKGDTDLNMRLIQELYNDPKILTKVNEQHLKEKYGDMWENRSDILLYVEEELKENVAEFNKPVLLLYKAFLNRNAKALDYLIDYLHFQRKYISEILSKSFMIESGEKNGEIWYRLGKFNTPYLSVQDSERVNQILYLDATACFLLKRQKEKLSEIKVPIEFSNFEAVFKPPVE